MMNKFKIIGFFFLVVFCGELYANNNYKIHLITFYDNVDEVISDGCKVDKQNFQSTIEKVADKLQVELIHYNPENEYSFDKMLTTYPKMKVDANDIVIFFYSGHGFHSTKQSNENKYPFMFFTSKDVQKYNLLRVHEGLKLFKARLTITFGDLCNSMMEGPKDDVITFGEDEEQFIYYKKLFSNAKGDFIESSSDVGEASFVRIDDSDGSYFTYNFNLALNYILDNPTIVSDENATWEYILNYTRISTIEQTKKAKNAGAKYEIQHPIYDINMNYKE